MSSEIRHRTRMCAPPAVVTITDGSGNPCYEATFTPYGQEMPTKSNWTCSTDYKFTGYERDSETGLDYAFARYYNSRLGRFMSADPLAGDVGDPQSLNRYAYTENSPTNFMDPAGLFRWCPNTEACTIGGFGNPNGGSGAQWAGWGLDFVVIESWDEGTLYNPGYGYDSPLSYYTVNWSLLAPGTTAPILIGQTDGLGLPQGAGTSSAISLLGMDWFDDQGYLAPVTASSRSTVSAPGPRKSATFKMFYDECVKNSGATLKVADSVGVWGLGSAAFSLAETGATKGMQWVFGTTAKNIAQTVATQVPTPTTEGILATLGEKASFWEGTVASAGKLSGYATIAGTSVSAAVRAYCLVAAASLSAE